MAPDPQRRRFVLPAATLLVGLGMTAPTALTGALTGTAHAAPARPQTVPQEPKPSEAELKKRLRELNDEAERLTEQFNKARVDLGRAREAEKQARLNAERLERQAAPAREELGRLAAANYINGSPDTLFAMTGGTEGLSTSAYLVQNQASVIQGLQARISEADKARTDAQNRARQVQQAYDRAKQARDAAKTKVDEVVRQLDKLSITRITDPKTGLKATVKGTDLPAKMARKALTKIGSPYVWAAAGPTTFDCSGLVVWAYAQVGKKGLPHYTGDLYQLGHKVDRGELRSGDLVYFGSNLHHMGIYLSDGKYLHAPQTGDVVKISKLSDRSDYAGANRIP
ncbi:NlpC/P60 family protein [Actinomadura kijaniata]|uniref:C40 family peptidase n=1 Tax=Actinomadura kijaniata TaxID=46161 RepID=UPI003F19E9D2